MSATSTSPAAPAPEGTQAPETGKTSAVTGPARPSFLARHYFLLRRLHSLAGVVPIGVFVIFHLFTNAQMIFGAVGMEDHFQHEVNWIHSLPALIFLEVFGIWLPIAFHAGLGIAYTFTGRPNTHAYRYGDNRRYLFQRVTGVIALVFIFLHLSTLRWGWNIFGWYTPFFVTAVNSHGHIVATDPNTHGVLGLASASVAIAFNGGPQGTTWAAALVIALYVVGILAVVYHWSNGLWTSAITWGLTTSVASMRRWGYVCATMGIVLTVLMGMALYGSITYQPNKAEVDAWNTLAHEQGVKLTYRTSTATAPATEAEAVP